jgi:DNA modification methylase
MRLPNKEATKYREDFLDLVPEKERPIWEHVIRTIPSEGRYEHRTSYELPEVISGNGTEQVCPSWKKFPKNLEHPLHSLASRTGSFPPALPHYFIRHFSKEGDIVFDPFCGKGTTVLEALLNGRVGLGSDAAPEAVCISRAKIVHVELREVEEYLNSIEIQEAFLDLETVPPRVKIFFHPWTLEQIIQIKDQLLLDQDEPGARGRVARFLMGCLLGILHGKSTISLSIRSSHSYAMAPGYVERYAKEHNLEKPRRYVKICLLEKTRRLLTQGPVPRNRCRVYVSTAERYKFNRSRWLDGRVNLIVTSPPYMAAQTYAKDNWLRLWLLGFDFRRVRQTLIQTNSIDTYSSKMRRCLQQMLQALAPGAHAFIVIGDVFKSAKGKKVLINLAELLAELAEQVSTESSRFSVEEIINDVIPGTSRYYSSHLKDGNSSWDADGNGTGIRIERIVHLIKQGE